MTHLHDLIYCGDQIGLIDLSKLAVLFILVHLKYTHPTVYKALSPTLMDRSISLAAFEQCMLHFYEAQATHNPDQLTFPIIPSDQNMPAPNIHPSLSSSTIVLPAYLSPCVKICPNCKKPGHTIDFCISPGGKMEGQSTSDAITRQHAAHEASCNPCQFPIGTPSSSIPPTRTGNDNTLAVWIGGIRYLPTAVPGLEPEKASITEVEVETAMTAADQGEYLDWAINSNDMKWTDNGAIDMAVFLFTNIDTSWADSGDIDMAVFLLAAIDTSLSIADNGPLLYLDSEASTHISCVHSDFSKLRPIEPRTIMGVGNSSVSAIGIGTVEILIHETSVCPLQCSLCSKCWCPSHLN
ncbi:hypothetical protein EI94DRAFT_1702912 [Lactarius quietus]|nr:hypothetical protein EI94DRAFT_1702912 [Lactarius quietus]